MSQIGPDYTYNNPDTTTPATKQKLTTLARKDPALAKFVSSIVGAQPTSTTPENVDGALNKLDKYSRNVIQTLFAQELAIAKTTQKATESVTNTITGAREGLADGLDTVSNKINETMKPVSTALGSVLGTLTGMMQDPLGSVTALPRTLADVVEKVNPKFAAKLEATYKKYKLDNFAHLPEQIMGSIKNLMTALDALISLPLQIMQDLYQGLMDIMQEISSLVEEAIALIVDFFFGPGGLLDSLVPIAEIMEFLEAVAELAGEINGIASIFLASNPISEFALNVETFSNQLQGAISNPVNLLAAYAPPEVSQGLYTLRNPQQLINNILPPGISEQFAKLSSITGFGFNGNMGFGFESVLEGLKGGVINSILSQFAAQYSILTPLLGLAGGKNEAAPLNTGIPPTVQPSSVNPNVSVVQQGVPQPQTEPGKPIPETTTA